MRPSNHFKNLTESYNKVGSRTWLTQDFLESELDASRSLFTPNSLKIRQPRPKDLEVYALLSGLPFEFDFTEKLVEIQRRISEILGDTLHYWVKPLNLGVEYCVFKWPTGAWVEEWIDLIQNELISVNQPSFRFNINGIQINPDGCLVAKGFDEGAVLFGIRKFLIDRISFMPSKQSSWAHVPLGRILEPIGADRFSELAKLIRILSDLNIASTEIKSVKFIHESRWYMEKKSNIAEYALNSANSGVTQ